MPEIFKKNRNLKDLMKSPDCFEELINLDIDLDKGSEYTKDDFSVDNFNSNHIMN